MLSEHRIPVKGAVVNNIFPENTDCHLCSSRYRVQSKYIKAIEEAFQGLELAKIPVFDTEIQGLEALKRFSREIMDGGQLKIEGRKSIEKEYDEENGIFHIHLFYPEARKSDLQLKTKGQLLIVMLHGIRSEIEVPFKVDSKNVLASFEEDYLHITVKH
jgi:hypothetical protein